MNKNELIDSVSAKTGMNKKNTAETLNALFESISEALVKGDKVSLLGFGSFETKTRAQRSGRNPRTGEAVIIPSKKAPVFKASKNLKDSIN